MKKVAKTILIVCGLLFILLVGAVCCSGDEETASSTSEVVATESANVSIDGASFGSDYEGNKTIIIDYSWVNDSDSASSFGANYTITVYQDGVELNEAISTDSDHTITSVLNDVKPGVAQSFQGGYVLTSSSPVEVEITEYWGSDIVAAQTYEVE